MMMRSAAPFVLLVLSACGQDEKAATGPSVEDAIRAKGGAPEASIDVEPATWAVASAHPLATEAGAEILKEGGSAVDAAVAVQSVLGLVEPQSSGLGGGAFMLYYDAATGQITAYDGREVAPLSAGPAMFLKEDGSRMGFYNAVTSGLAVGVPGAVAMLDLAHREHGELDWARLFARAETLADEGFIVGERLPSLLGRFVRLKENSPAAAALYYNDDGTPIKAGSTLKNPAYAETVRTIAQGGASGFYTGTIAEAIVAAVNDKAGEGTMTLDDLSAYEPVKRTPVCAEVMVQTVCTMPPPSSGVTMLQILALAEEAGLMEATLPAAWGPYAEATRLAYADRARYIGDPSAMGLGDVSPEDLIEGLVHPDYIAARATLIGEAAAETVAAGDPTPYLVKDKASDDASPDLPGTSHFSIRDTRGNIVSMTTTVEFAFGSHLMAGGMILNNQLTDFSFVAEEDGVPVVNAAAAGKRPRSSMSPTIVLGADGTPQMAIGSPGGPAIIGYVAKTLFLTMGHQMSLQEAVEFPNIVVPRGSVLVEEGADPAINDAVEAYGLKPISRGLTSGLYGFADTPEGIETGVDPRREGSALTGQ